MIAEFDEQLTTGYTTDNTTFRVVGSADTPDYRARLQLKAAGVTPLTNSNGNFNVATGAPVHATPAAYGGWTTSNPADTLAFAVDGTSATRGIASGQLTAATYASGAASAGLFVLNNLYAGTPGLRTWAGTDILPASATFGLSGLLMNLVGTRVYALSAQGNLYCFNVPAATSPATEMTKCTGSWPYAAGGTVTWSSPYPTYKNAEIANIYFGNDSGGLFCVQGNGGTSPGTNCTGWSGAGTLVAGTPGASALGAPAVNIDTTTGKNTIIVGDANGRYFRVTDVGSTPAVGAYVESQDLCGGAPNSCATSPWAIHGSPALNFASSLAYVASGGKLFEFPMTKEQNGGNWQANATAKTLFSGTMTQQIDGSVIVDPSGGYAYVGFNNTLYKAKVPFDGTATGGVYSQPLNAQVPSVENYPRGYPLVYYNSVYIGTGTTSGTTGIVEQYGCTTSSTAPTLEAISSSTAGNNPPFGSLIETGEVLTYQNSSIYFGYDSGSTGGLVAYPAANPSPGAEWACPSGRVSVSNSSQCGSGATVCETSCGSCTLTSNVATTTCSSGGCQVATCNTGFADCDGDYSNGCEVNLQTDTTHCGSCTNVCPSLNETPSCSGGTCGGTCNSGYAACGASGCGTAISCSSCCGSTCTGGGTVGSEKSCVSGACSTATQTICATVNEHATATVTCPTGSVIQAVSFVSFGTPNGSCGAFTTNTACDDAPGDTGSCSGCNKNERLIAAELCYGKNTCSLLAEDTVAQSNGTTFGDPCSGTFKRLYLQVECACPTVAPECSNGFLDANETDVDCGGAAVPSGTACSKCGAGKKCLATTDCLSGTCTSGVCASSGAGGACSTGTDCSTGTCTSGVCGKSDKGGSCGVAADCSTGICTSSVCGIADAGGTCAVNTDCSTGTCTSGTCAKSDKGGSCAVAADCSTDICTSSVCGIADAGGTCAVNGDCSTGTCTSGKCAKSALGGSCAVAADCTSTVCTSGICEPTCATASTKCAVGAACAQNSDCGSGTCTSGACVAAAQGGSCISDTDCSTLDCWCGTASSGACTSTAGTCKAGGVLYTAAGSNTVTVPPSCTTVYVEAWGAGGGGGAANVGGGGGYASAAYAVVAGDVITTVVGGGGASATGAATAGSNGGGAGVGGGNNKAAGGGGGATTVSFATSGGTSVGALVAGAGGGASDDSAGGAGGGGTAGNGAAGSGTNNYCNGGLGGSTTAGGTGGTGTAATGTTGGATTGGAASTSGGGGGGGGAFGGGGGGARTTFGSSCQGSGGGGASAFTSATAGSTTATNASSSTPGGSAVTDFVSYCSANGHGGAATAAGQAGCVVLRCE